ncbi:Crp/Fnr family transcriptional regulator [Prevotella multiformis]|uniref:Crp/Fnr family transcriptional regulator n=1 Tax=Prevotella multiformis TaxID=282402 RepID=UPI0023F4C07E|nr:Crp/Fnr family transcriptional regulator [Prevotella multiformis]
MLQLYNKLLELPLFIGISTDELSDIIEQTKFGFHKLPASRPLIRKDEKCDCLFFLMSGVLQVASYADSHRYCIEEELKAPAVIQPEHLFGLMQYYTKDVTAQTDCSLLSLAKPEVLRLLDSYLIFRLNFLNSLSMQAQRMGRIPWQKPSDDIRQQFITFLRHRCMTQAGRKILRIRMEDLAHELHQSRINVSRMLHQLQREGMLSMGRSILTVPRLETLRD